MSLQVVSREKIQRARSTAGDQTDPIELAQSLGCRWVLAGGVQRAGGTLRLTARLVEVSTTRIVLADKLDGSLDGFFALQDRLSAGVAGALAVHAPSTAKGIRPALDAFECYARGRRLFRRFEKGGLEQAQELFARAVTLQPDYAEAHAGLAGAAAMRFPFTSDVSVLDTALDHARRAIGLDPASSEAHVWLCYALWRRGQIEEALVAAAAATNLDADDFFGRYFAGTMLAAQGRYGEAVAPLQQAVDRNPRYGIGWQVLGLSHMSVDQLTEAIWCLRRAEAIENDPGASDAGIGAAALIGEALRRRGDPESGRAAALQSLPRLEASDHMYRDSARAGCLIVIGRCALDQGDGAAAEAAFTQAELQVRGRPRAVASGHLLVEALAGLARATGAVDQLDAAAAILAARAGFNFGYGAGGADEAESLIDLATGAVATDQTTRAGDWLEAARARGASPFRIREVEAALARSRR